MHKIGRFLQVLGLMMLPLALLLNVIPARGSEQPILTVGQQMLAVVGIGISLFWIGRILEGYAKR